MTVGVVGLLAGIVSHAAPLSIPNTFVSGTPAKAEQVNQNFAAIAAAVNANDQRLAGLLSSPGSPVVQVGATIIGRRVSSLTNLGPLSFEASEFNSGFVTLNFKGLFVAVGTGVTATPPPTEREFSASNRAFSVTTTQPAEGSLLPLAVAFTEANCTGTPFISLSPQLMRQGIVFGNPADLQQGYFAKGEGSQMAPQSALVFVRPNSKARLPDIAVEGMPFCLDRSNISFQRRTLLGVPVIPNDPQVTGVPNGMSGPISYTVTH